MKDSRTILDEVTDQLDLGAPLDCNIQHLRHVLWGYRDWLLNREVQSIYSPGSAADLCWHEGRRLAEMDLPDFAVFADDRPDEFVPAVPAFQPDLSVAIFGTLSPSAYASDPSALAAVALSQAVIRVIGDKVGNFIYYNGSCEEIVEVDGMRLKLIASGWVWLRHCKTTP